MHWLTGSAGMGMRQCWGSQSLLWWIIVVKTSPVLSLLLLRKTAVTVNLHKGGLLKTWLLIKLSHSKSHLVLWGILSPFSYKADLRTLWRRKPHEETNVRFLGCFVSGEKAERQGTWTEHSFFYILSWLQYFLGKLSRSRIHPPPPCLSYSSFKY